MLEDAQLPFDAERLESGVVDCPMVVFSVVCLRAAGPSGRISSSRYSSAVQA